VLKYRLASFLFAALLALPAQAESPVDTILAAAKSSCERLDSGRFDPGDSVQRLDLTGNGSRGTIVDESRFSCSSARSLYCGSGGCQLHAIVGDRSWSFQAEGWRMIEWDGRPILLVMRDGGWCGGAGAQICYEAVSWSHGQMLTVMPPVEPAR
jgi:hypothetical protein